MDSPVQKIKERLSIEEVVSSYIKLEKSGINWKAKCPFHNEKTPSFFVSPNRNSFYCFGCGSGGDIFTFVEQFEGLDFSGTLKLLAARAGVPLSSNSTYEKQSASEKELLFRIVEQATKFFEDSLRKNKDVLDYLKNRGLSEESIKIFRVGFVPNEWRSLFDYLKHAGFNEDAIEKAGLAKKADKTTDGKVRYYDRFRGRIMFPISDSSGRVIAFSGRLFEKIFSQEERDKLAKYVNSPETPIFSKSAVLYGIDKAKDSIRKNNFSILVEGQMDLILSHQAGFKNTVASSGTALSDSTLSKENVVSNLGLIRRLSENIVLAFDADKAGINAASRAGKIALSFGMDVKVASLESGLDPADTISKKGTDAWRESIRGSKHLIEFLLDKAMAPNQDPRKSLREIKDKVLPYVAALESGIEKSHFLKLISDKSGAPVASLEEDLKKMEKDAAFEREETESALSEENKIFKKDKILQKIIGIVLWQETLATPKIDVKVAMDKLRGILKNRTDEILRNFSERKGDLIFEAEVFYQEEADLKKDIEELLDNLKEEVLKEELEQKMFLLRKAKGENDKDLEEKIFKECKEISEQIENIKNNRSK